ncbi:MAG: hypothetical protein IKC94_01250 [Lentisphaeria bacterium]|nr:hypothetical protein [Lentisphaeria bacterium]
MSAINNKNFELLSGNVTLYPGQRVIKIGDKLFPAGIGNNAMPVKPVKFYKCRRVNAAERTWEGYEVTFDTVGIADISTTLTTGLTYGEIVPQRTNIYSADASQLIQGAIMSGVPKPIMYNSGETLINCIGPVGMSDSNKALALNGDRDNTGCDCRSEYQPANFSGYYDGVYHNLPGFPESASGHDWAFAMWANDLRAGRGTLRVGGETGTCFKLMLDGYWYSFTAQAGVNNEATGRIDFTPNFALKEWQWQHLAVNYSASDHKFTVYVDGNLLVEMVDDSGVERSWKGMHYGSNGGNCAYVYIFDQQLSVNQIRTLVKQKWPYEGIYLSGLDDVYNMDYGMDVSPNGELKANGLYMFKPKYYVNDPESGMSSCNIQWDGNKWEIFVYEYDENWNSIKKVIAVGMGGDVPEDAEWIDVGHGLAKIDARYANGI